MKKEKVLKILTVVLMVTLVIGVARSSFAATQTITAIENSTGNGTNNTVNNIASNEPANNTLQNNTAVNNLPVNNVPTNTALPDTGVSSNIGLVVLITLASVSAVYTYMKVRKYNI